MTFGGNFENVLTGIFVLILIRQVILIGVVDESGRRWCHNNNFIGVVTDWRESIFSVGFVI